MQNWNWIMHCIICAGHTIGYLGRVMMPGNWLNFEEAVVQAKDMVATLYVTIQTKKATNNFLVEVHGIEQMAALNNMLDKLQKDKKIVDWDAKNLALFSTFDMDGFKQLISKL
jgi:hypothetical protein